MTGEAGGIDRPSDRVLVGLRTGAAGLEEPALRPFAKYGRLRGPEGGVDVGIAR